LTATLLTRPLPKSPLPRASATSRISTACSSAAMVCPRGSFAAQWPHA